MIVQVREIPEEGLQLQGEITEDIFELKEENVANVGGVQYDLHVSIVTGMILARGPVSASFKQRCARCLEEFTQTINLPDFAFSEPVEGTTIDLTPPIREDILLALPIHPLCENGTPPRECPAAGHFEERADEAMPGDSESSDDAWSGLEGFEPK